MVLCAADPEGGVDKEDDPVLTGGDDALSDLYGPGEPASKPVAGSVSAPIRPPTTPGEIEIPPCWAGQHLRPTTYPLLPDRER